MNRRMLHSAEIPAIGRWHQFPDPKHLGSPRGATPDRSPTLWYRWRVLSHRYAEVDLAMKAKALNECSNPAEALAQGTRIHGLPALTVRCPGSVALLKAGEIMLRPWTVRLARRWLSGGCTT